MVMIQRRTLMINVSNLADSVVIVLIGPWLQIMIDPEMNRGSQTLDETSL